MRSVAAHPPPPVSLPPACRLSSASLCCCTAVRLFSAPDALIHSLSPTIFRLGRPACARQIRDTSTGFSRSAVLLSNGTWANCASSIETAANLTRGGFASLLSDMNPQRDGTALVNGTTARQFTFTMTSGIANVPGIPSAWIIRMITFNAVCSAWALLRLLPTNRDALACWTTLPACRPLVSRLLCAGTSVLPAFTPIMRLSYYDSEVAPHLPRRIRFEDLYPNQPPEYADNYVLDVELFEPVTVFPQGTFAVSAPATCDALLAAAPPQAYPSELSVRFLTNAEIAALEVAAGINGTADAIVATGGRRRLQRLAGRVASNQRDLQSGRSVSGCVNMYGNNMVRLPRVVTLVTIQGAVRDGTMRAEQRCFLLVDTWCDSLVAAQRPVREGYTAGDAALLADFFCWAAPRRRAPTHPLTSEWMQLGRAATTA